MSEMGDLVRDLHLQLGVPPGEIVGPSLPIDASAPVTPPADPGAPAAAPAVSPTLRDWLLHHFSGNNVLDDAQYDYFHGDEVLRQVQQFDPNASWSASQIGGGEGGGTGMGRRLDFDLTKLPGVGGPGGGASIFDTGFVPVYDGSHLHNPNMVYDDEHYGNLTPFRNKVADPGFLERYAPLIAAAISMGAPIAAGALAAGGIGAGAAGAYGAGAGAWGGAALADGVAAAPWWATSAAKGLPAAGRAVSEATNKPTPAFRPPAYDPTAYNSGGSTAKPTSNDSSLVATQFASDPYGFSGKTYG